MRFAGSSYKMKDMTPKKSYPVLKNQLHTGHKPERVYMNHILTVYLDEYGKPQIRFPFPSGGTKSMARARAVKPKNLILLAAKMIELNG